MNDNVLQFVIRAKDEATSSLKGFSETAGKMKVAFTVAGAAITAALGSTLESAADAQVEMAKFDTILEAVKTTGTTFEKQISSTATTMKYSSSEVANFKNKIDDAKLSIKEKEMSLSHLDAKLKAGKITSAEYTLAIERQKMSIKNLKEDIADYGNKINETTSKTTSSTVTMKKQVAVTDEVKKSLLAAADASLKMGFDNEEAAVGLAKIFQRTGSVTESIKLNNLAMDLARAKNISLAQASDTVGMVLSGNGKVLKQFGIAVDETKSPMEQLAQLQGKVTGQAKAFSETFAGQKEILTQNVGEMREAIGGALLPVVTQLGQALLPVVLAVSKWTQENPELFNKIVLVTGAIGGLMLIVGPVAAVISGISAAVGVLNAAFLLLAANPIILVIGAIILLLAALGYALYEVWQHQDELHKKMVEMWTAVKIFIFTILTSIASFIVEKSEAIKQSFVDAFMYVKDMIFGVFDAIQGKISAVVDWAVAKINSMMSMLSSVTSSISSGFSSASGAVSSLFGGKRADGGPVSSNRGYLVGERGPEMFYPNASGRVAPTSSGGLTVIIQGNSFMGDEDAAIRIGNLITQRLGLVQRI